MPRKSLQKRDYILKGREKGLVHLGPAPKNVYTKTKWRCERCGQENEITYRAVDFGPGCSCKSEKTKQPKDYRALAESLGIVWVYDPEEDLFPRNTKTHTFWRSKNGGELVSATWNQLSNYLSDSLRERLGIPED